MAKIYVRKVRRVNTGLCSSTIMGEPCPRDAKAGGMCKMHYGRQRHGTLMDAPVPVTAPRSPKPPPLRAATAQDMARLPVTERTRAAFLVIRAQTGLSVEERFEIVSAALWPQDADGADLETPEQAVYASAPG